MFSRIVSKCSGALPLREDRNDLFTLWPPPPIKVPLGTFKNVVVDRVEQLEVENDEVTGEIDVVNVVEVVVENDEVTGEVDGI